MRRRRSALAFAAVFVVVVIAVAIVGTGAFAPSPPIALAENGPITFVRSAGRDAGLLEVDPVTRAVRPLVTGRGTVSTPAWSPDGRFLAYAWRDPTAGGYRIRVMDAEGGGDRILTPADAIDGSPSWSPSGDRIAYSSNRGGLRVGIFTLGVGGSSGPDGVGGMRLTDGQAPAWSPSGEWVAFVRLVDGQYDLFVVRPDGRDLRNLTANPGDDIDPAWAPDGSWIVFASDRGGDYDLYRLDPETGAVSVLLGGPTEDRGPVVSPDGRLIAFSRTADGGANLWLTDGQGGSTRLTDDPLFDVDPAWQPLGGSPSE